MSADIRSVTAIVRLRFLFWLDAILLVAVAALQTPRATGLAGHEWLGLAFAAIVAVHLLVNWRWIVGTLRRITSPGSRRSKINLLLNGTLFVFMALTVFSGLVISEVVLPLIGFQPSILRAWRQIHSLFSTLSIVIVGFHLGLNWDWIAGAIRKRVLVQGVGHATAVSEVEVAAPSERKEGEADHRAGVSRSVMKALGLQDFATACRRFGLLALTVMAFWACCFALIESTASKTIRDRERGLAGASLRTDYAPQSETGERPRRERVWASPSLTDLPKEVGIQLLIIGIAAVAGKKLLRLRL
jgi:Domain of unknown function (DUF4405)